MTRAQQMLIDSAMGDLRAVGYQLRKEGWPTELMVNYIAERDAYSVSLTIELPRLPEPIEARGASNQESSPKGDSDADS